MGGNAIWGTEGWPLGKSLYTTPRATFLSSPVPPTSLTGNMFYFPAAWKSKSMLLSFAFSAHPSLISSSLPMLTTLPSSLQSHHHIVLLSILPLLLTHVFWLRIPSSAHQTKLPLEKQNKTKLFSFSRTTGECGLSLDPRQQSHTFPKFSIYTSSLASALPYLQSFRCLKLPSVLSKIK